MYYWNLAGYLVRRKLSLKTLATSFFTFAILGDIAHTADATTRILSQNVIEFESENDQKNVTELALHQNEHDMVNVVLFPWFAVLIGVCAYYFLSRYVPSFPYTAVMFMTGTIMGYSSLHTHGNAIVDSIRLWLGINGQVIMLLFLPALLFLDSFNINAFLFKKSFWQIIIFAFPMVLAGAALTALFAYYIFPYKWSFDLSMTFGSILAATDPVAVIVMMNSLGAPSRLVIHISGESLMNDGSSVVFYSIFSARYFYEMDIHGVGEDIDLVRGLILFLRLALGGMFIGLAFGVGLVALLFILNRRQSKEESIIQTSSTIMTAYLTYYVSEVICGCSGIIAVLFCGLTTKTFGETLINDLELTTNFWHIMEHLLNTILFTLAGIVWAGVISNTESFNGSVHRFRASDWLYLFALFFFINIIRIVLIFAFYPITSKIGASQKWDEALFMSYGGLRGPVSICVALMLNAKSFQYSKYLETEDKESKYQTYADQLFGMIGGIAFLTIVINGSTSGNVLKALGLATPSAARDCIIKKYEQRMRHVILMEFITILSEESFSTVDYGIVRDHVSSLKDVTPQELNLAVQAYKKKHPYDIPNLDNLIHYVCPESTEENPIISFRCEAIDDVNCRTRKDTAEKTKFNSDRLADFDMRKPLDEDEALEKRQIFLNLIRQEYHSQLKTGELDSRGFTPFSLFQSLDVANDLAREGFSLQDWDVSQSLGKVTRKLDNIFHTYWIHRIFHCKDNHSDLIAKRSHVIRALSCIKAHKTAQDIFKAVYTSVDEQSLTLAEEVVINESKEQVSLAEDFLTSISSKDLNVIKSHYICQILLYKSVDYFKNLVLNGSMTEREAKVFLERYDIELRQL